MEPLAWNELKSKRLKKTRGASFEELIKKGELIATKDHPSRMLQELLLFKYKKYIWVVPFVRNEGRWFLKTLYPSRKYTKLLKERGL